MLDYFSNLWLDYPIEMMMFAWMTLLVVSIFLVDHNPIKWFKKILKKFLRIIYKVMVKNKANKKISKNQTSSKNQDSYWIDIN